MGESNTTKAAVSPRPASPPIDRPDSTARVRPRADASSHPVERAIAWSSLDPPVPEELELPRAPDRYDLALRRIGNVLDGKWKLDSLLGVGGMAAVYAATHRNGARAAIKLLPFGMADGPELCQRLLREGYLANKINHPAVVRVLDDDIDYDKEYAYIVMELLDGETARQRVTRAGTFETLQAISLMVELCDCLRAAHHSNVVHRDIKPENLFLTKDGLKVLDFGIARAIDGNSSLTQTGVSLGTPAYISPEQARGKQHELTPRSDLYSVGATLMFLLTGETLHEAGSPMELMMLAAWTPPPRAKKRCPSLSDPIAEVIDRCCAFDPDDRYPDADAVIAALEIVYRGLSSAPPPAFNRLVLAPPEPGKLPPPRVDHMAETLDAAAVPAPRRHFRTVWLYAAGGAALAVGLAFFFADRSPPLPDASQTSHEVAAEKGTLAAPKPLTATIVLPEVPSTAAAERLADATSIVTALSASGGHVRPVQSPQRAKPQSHTEPATRNKRVLPERSAGRPPPAAPGKTPPPREIDFDYDSVEHR